MLPPCAEIDKSMATNLDGALDAYSMWLDTVCASIGIKAHAHAGTQLLALARRLLRVQKPEDSRGMGDLLIAHAQVLEAVFAREINLLKQGKSSGTAGPVVVQAVEKQRHLIAELRKSIQHDEDRLVSG